MEPQNPNSPSEASGDNSTASVPEAHSLSSAPANPEPSSSADQVSSQPVNVSGEGSSMPSTQSESVATQPMPASPMTAAPIAPAEQPAMPQNQAPVVMGSPVIGGADQPPVTTSSPSQMSSGSGKKGWMLPGIIAVVIVLLLGGGYVFGIYLPNRPSAVYRSSLSRAGDALDTLINYSTTASKKNYKSYTVDASLKSSGDVSFDATLSGSGDQDGNAKFTASADIMGEKLNANLDTVHVAGSDTPDLYVQLGGIKPILDSYGLNQLDSLDGQWLAVDHTLLDSSLSSLNQNASSVTKATSMPSMAQIDDAIAKVQTVNKRYLFSTDAGTAVLTDNKYIGKETKDGRSVYHYQVGYNKAHLQAYLTALGTALDNSSLNTWSKTANDGKSLSEQLNLSSLQDSVAKQSGNYTFDLWVDTKTKLPHTLQFVDPSDKTSSFTISQNYTGGTSYPFAFGFTGKDATSGDAQNLGLNITVDTSTNKVSGKLAVTQGTTANVSATFDITPSQQSVQVTAPAGAKPIANIIAALGLGTDPTTGL